MLLHEQSVLVLDCQTTGATPDCGSLLEIAWAIFCPRSEQIQLESHVILNRSVPRQIQKLTGLSEKEASQGVPQQQVWERLKRDLERTPSFPRVIHFSQFEMRFLNDMFIQHEGKQFPDRVICTHIIAKRLFPNLPARSLRGLAGYFGHSLEPLKRAQAHVAATAAVWSGLVRQLEQEGVHTLQELEKWLEQPVTRPRIRKYAYNIDPLMRLNLPDQPGIYRMLNQKGEILYIGKATSLRERVNSYFRGQRGRNGRTLEMLTQVRDISVTPCQSVLEAAIAESDAIKTHNPYYNLNLIERNRSLYFFTSGLERVSKTPSKTFCVGPFLSPHVFESLQEAVDEEFGTDEGLSAEEIFEKRERLLHRIEEAIGRAQQLTQLLNATVVWRESSACQFLTFHFMCGTLVKTASNKAASILDWRGNGVDVYDRMSVAWTEIQKRRKVDPQSVSIDFHGTTG